jgi:hypothetical protein
VSQSERTAMLSSILQKPLGAVTVLGTAIGGPYALFETDAGTATRVAIAGMLGSPSAESSSAPSTGGAVAAGAAPIAHSMLLTQAPAASASVSAAATSTAFPVTPTAAQVPSWTPPPIADLREVIRFDMTPLALPQRFAQVTTMVGQPPFDVYRVALVTGTGPSDLVGTLTYFFNANQAVQRIQFVGTTGDPAMIAGMMVHYYSLRPETGLGGQLFTTRWNNRITSLLQIRASTVMSAQTPNSNYQVFLELNQPSTHYGLSEEAYRATGLAPPQTGSSLFGF